MKLFLYTILFFLVLSCSGNDASMSKRNVYEIRNLGQLSTTEYTIGKIIKLEDVAKDYEWYEYDKYGDRKILISCKAKVKAGIDLSKIKDEDIKVVGSTIEIQLPQAEITSFSMDPSQIRTEMEKVTGFRKNFTQEEKTDFLKQGEESIRKELYKTGILEDANDNAEAFLIDFYKQLGFKEVIVKRSKSDYE